MAWTLASTSARPSGDSLGSVGCCIASAARASDAGSRWSGITATPAAAQAARRANSRREMPWEDFDDFFFSVMGLSTSAALQAPAALPAVRIEQTQQRTRAY